MTILLNPNKLVREYPDAKDFELMKKTVEFFEHKGKVKLKNDDNDCVWYQDFLDFQKQNQIFAKLLTPAEYGQNDPTYRWDTWRLMEFAEILAFYGLHYWYTWQVSILGLGPLFISKNDLMKKKTAKYLREGGIFGFGLSEKEHGADIYSTSMLLKDLGNGEYSAKGSKYYIGNGNKASIVSIFGKLDKPAPNTKPDDKYNKYVFFGVNSQHPNYECVRNVVKVQSYVAEFKLNDYPITEEDILAKGRDAWDMSLNTVNIGKYNLGWGSIGICTHSLYEALNHASHRNLYGKFVTEFAHIKSFFVDAYCRLVAMKLFALRAGDYMRTASLQDRRYLLFNPMVKMKVTSQGEEVVNLLWDVIAARGFEAETYFSQAARDIRALPKLEGTVHVNMALIIKFMLNYFYFPDDNLPIIPGKVNAAKDDTFLFDQGTTSGLSEIKFHDYKKVYNSVDLPNVNIFKDQIKKYVEFGMNAAPKEAQAKDLDFLLIAGELFTLVVYGELIIENQKYYDISNDLLEQIFDFLIRDFSKYALALYSKPSTNTKQQEYLLQMIKRPIKNDERFEKIVNEVYSLKDLYEMRP